MTQKLYRGLTKFFASIAYSIRTNRLKFEHSYPEGGSQSSGFYNYVLILFDGVLASEG